jgi:uncharacterized protein
MRIAVTGGTGFVGRTLLPTLLARGHQVVVFTRAKPAAGALPAGVEARVVDYAEVPTVAKALEGCEAVINLAGAGIFDKRWTKAYKREIMASRVLTTRALVDAMRSMTQRPGILLSGSAVGHYGPRTPGETVDESTARMAEHHPADFLAHVCFEWEREAVRAEVLGMRVAFLRLGVVLGRDGGAMSKLLTPFKMGVGGPIGSGKQDMSWVHVEDVAGLIAFALENAEVRGPLNVTAPHPVSNKEFAKALGRALGRPSFLPTPGFALRLGLGEAAGMLITGQRVLPMKALGLGYVFRYSTIDAALASIVAATQAA